MKVRITKPARNDLRDIFKYLRKEAGTKKAREFTSEIRERCAGLDRMPERYQKLDGYEIQGLRRRVYRDYLIVYRILEMQVEVIRIMHGAADIEEALSYLQ